MKKCSLLWSLSYFHNFRHKKEELKLESIQKKTEKVVMPPMTLQNLVSVQLPLQLKNPEVLPKHEAFEIVNELLIKHDFKTTIGILSIMLMFNKRYQISSAKDRANDLIIAVYQHEVRDWVNSFGGNIFVVPLRILEHEFV